MMIRSLLLSAAALAVLTALDPGTPARAGGYGMGGAVCLPNTRNIVKNFTFNKNININKNTYINKNIAINKNINITKNIDLSKKIEINKNIVINKGPKSGSEAEAFAAAYAYASAQAEANSAAFAYARTGGSYVTVVNRGGEIGQLAVAQPEETCVTQWATVVKSIHAECVDKLGEHHPATRMIPETWVDSSTEKEIFRCLPGSTLKVIIGDVVQSDHGLAGIYQGGTAIACGPGEALRHFKDGLVKCAVAEKVPDCTERTNLRKYGIGDLFFTYQSQVCAKPPEPPDGVVYSKGGYSKATGETRLSNMTFDGGVGYGE
jgi:hypothetical protein